MLETRLRPSLAIAAIGLLLAALLAACGPAPAPAAEEPMVEEPAAEEAMPEGKYNESPMLAAMVAAGELPPVDERVPVNPRVGVPQIPADWGTQEVGQYGGTLRLIDYDQGSVGHDAGWLRNEFWLATEGLAHDPDLLHGNVMADVDVLDDGARFRFHMRQGMKFSDGSAFTTEDVAFWHNDLRMNETVTPVLGAAWRSGRSIDGEPMTLDVIDDYTFEVGFTEPYGSFLSLLTYGTSPFITDSGFLKQFHGDYTDMDTLNPMITEAGFEEGEWWRLLGSKMNQNRQHETGLPNVAPYLLTSMGPTRATMTRNPYYFKVDEAGNQLPYIDEVEISIVSDVEAATLEIIAGNVDLARRPVNPQSIPLYKENEGNGYQTRLQAQHASLGEVFINLTSDADPVWAETMQDLRVRQALSLALDRDHIIDAVYLGLASPPRVIPLNVFDQDAANGLLDEAGLDQRDGDGMRLMSNGESFCIPFVMATFTGEELPVGEQVSRMWQDVGVCSSVKIVETNLFLEIAGANEHQAMTWWAHYPRWPYHEYNDYVGRAWQYTYAPLWYQWYNSGGEQGTEPPAEYVELRQMQDEMLATADNVRGKELWEAMKQNIADNVWWIPIVDDVLGPLIVSNRLQNVPDGGIAIENATAAEMFFISE